MKSFVKSPETGSAPAEPAAPTPTSAVATTPRPGAVAAPVSSAYVEGEITRDDLRMPYLSCVQAVGPKSVLFTPGQIVLGELPITDAPKPQQPTPRLRVLFCRVQKTYVENLPYNPAPDAPRPRIYKSAPEAIAAGAILEWRGNVAPTFIPKLTSLLLVRSPEGIDDMQFNIISGDKTYAPAMIAFQKTSYSAAKTLLTDLSLSLKGNPHGTFYDLFWAREQKGSNWVWVAKLVRVRDEQVPEDLKVTAQKLTGASTEVVEDDPEAA